MGGAYWETPVPESYLTDSPHSHVAKWNTPILMIQNHWILSPQNGVVWHREFYGWLDEWLK